MKESKLTIYRLSWICINDNKVLFVKNKKRDALFDPGGRWAPRRWIFETPGQQRERQIEELTHKVQRDLRITLVKPVTFLSSFRAPAYGKDEGAMVEMRMFMSLGHLGKILEHPSPQLETHWVKSRDLYLGRFAFSPAGEAIIQWLRDQGLIYY